MKLDKPKPQHPLIPRVSEMHDHLARLGYSVTQGRNMLGNCLVVRGIDEKRANLVRAVLKRESGLHVYITMSAPPTFVFTLEETRRSREEEPDPVASEVDNRREDYDGEYGTIPAHNPDRVPE
jgi:hypothetical protein